MENNALNELESLQNILTDLINNRAPDIESSVLQLHDSIIINSQQYQDQVRLMAELMIKELVSFDAISQFDRRLTDHPERDVIPLQVLVASKLARSKSYINQIQQSLLFSVCFAVYKETERLKSPEETPYGEDFLRRKIQQLDWITDSNQLVSWELIICDDGCPDGSGQAILELVDELGQQSKVKVVFLQDAIDAGIPVAASLSSTEKSRKGGSIQYAMYLAALTQHEHTGEREAKHIVIYTDADLSTHLGQLGLLAEPLIERNQVLALATRATPDAVQIRGKTRKARGNLFAYLKKALVKLPGLQDTQCGFKAVNAEKISWLVNGLIEKGFAFDIELLAKVGLEYPDGLEHVGIAWIDSEACSTTTILQPYLPMLNSCVKIYKHYFPANPRSEGFAQFVSTLTEERWQALVENVPAEIADREEHELETFTGVTPEMLEDAIASAATATHN